MSNGLAQVRNSTAIAIEYTLAEEFGSYLKVQKVSVYEALENLGKFAALELKTRGPLVGR